MYTFGSPLGIYVGHDVDGCNLTGGKTCPVSTSGSGVEWRIASLSLTFGFSSSTNQPAASTLAWVELLPYPTAK
jgi:hypothetical protein